MSASLAVLLVEDDPTAQSIALSMLRHLGIEADVASDGAQGVRAASERAYDLILMDIQMPVMDGVEALRAIRSASGDVRPRIVAVTEHTQPGMEARMVGVGFDGVVPKPFSIPALQQAVGQLPEEAPLQAPPAPIVSHDEGVERLLHDIRAHVRDLLGEDDEAFVADLVETFADSTRKALQLLAPIEAERDLDALARMAHAIKGSAANVGLSTLADAWCRIEKAARRVDATVFAEPLSAALAQTRLAIGLVTIEA